MVISFVLRAAVQQRSARVTKSPHVVAQSLQCGAKNRGRRLLSGGNRRRRHHQRDPQRLLRIRTLVKRASSAKPRNKLHNKRSFTDNPPGYWQTEDTPPMDVKAPQRAMLVEREMSMFGRWPKPRTPRGHDQSGNKHLIELRDVVKTFDTAAGNFTALKGVNLQVDAGEFVAVVGKSGSGKSTLINMITGIDRPTSGQVIVGNTVLHTLREGQLATWRGRSVGVVFQFFQLLPTLTAVENVMLPMDFCNTYTSRERGRRALHLLEQVGMAEQAHKLPLALSGGQQQRVAIARALATDPPIVVADEPTGNLDSATAETICQLFEQLVARGKTVLMVTHDDDLARRAGRAVRVGDGQIVEELGNTYGRHTGPTSVIGAHAYPT